MSETTTYAEFCERAQSEFLSSVKQAQALQFKALASFSELAATNPIFNNDGEFVEVLNPKAVIEQTFSFATKIIETQKEYMTAWAEIATDIQRAFVGGSKRVAETTKQHAVDASKQVQSAPKNTPTGSKGTTDNMKSAMESSKN